MFPLSSVSSRLVLVLVLLQLACGRADCGEAENLILSAVKNIKTMDRLTKVPYRMDVVAAAACGPPGAVNSDNVHDEYYCHVYMTKSGRGAFAQGDEVYPAGTVFIKRKFSDEAGRRTELFTVMRKMEPGYDDTHGNWEYSIVDKTGKRVLSRGRTDSCIDCHSNYRDSDYITRLYAPAHDRTGDRQSPVTEPSASKGAEDQ